MFADDIVAGRGFIAVALVYFGRWHPVGILGGSLLFSIAQSFQLSVQVLGIDFPYEFAVMLPYILVIVVLALARASKPTRKIGPWRRLSSRKRLRRNPLNQVQQGKLIKR